MRNAHPLGFVVGLWVTALVLLSVFGPGHQAHSSATPIYVQNLAPQYISDATIRRDIPAWQQAVNEDFAPSWNTPQYRLIFTGRRPAPKGAISAVFVKSGPVKGALAYHTVTRGVPQIVVYAGTGDYYGYDNSVSFTHELFELAADPTITTTNQGWPYDWIWTQTPDGFNQTPQDEGTVWAQEVCDPVEALSYLIDGVKISDFITPNWFNDEVAGGYDWMGAVQQPFTVLRGGYAQYFNGSSWVLVDDFRHAGRDADGYLLAEGHSRG